jgi:hypothetical protein
VLTIAASSCHAVAPVTPRFIILYEQQHLSCRVAVMRDTRSSACFLWAQCGRQPPLLLSVAPEVCVP